MPNRFGTHKKTYDAWVRMHQRCNNPMATQYKDYGGRGIKVCASWKVYENFLADMGEAPEGHSLDRINNNKGYCKENCRWATAKQQAQNRRMQSNNTSGVSGINFDKASGRWLLRYQGKYIGRYATLEEAVVAKHVSVDLKLLRENR